MKKKYLFNLSFEVVCDTTQPVKSLKNYIPQAGKVLRVYPEVLWTCQKFQGTGPSESFQQYMDMPRRENQETRTWTTQSPAQCVWERRRLLRRGHGRRQWAWS